jgi:hypothetical protein
MVGSLLDCCAYAASGTALETTIPVRKSRRRIAFLKAWDHANCTDDYISLLRPAKWGSGVSLRRSNPKPPMSALGQKQTSAHVRVMSALPPKAGIREHDRPAMAFCPFYYERRCKSEVCFFNFLSYSSVSPAFSVSPRPTLSVRKPLNNATAFGIVRADFNLHSVADCEAYVMNLKLPCGLCQYAMPAVQSDAKKVAAHRLGNGAKETGSRFLHTRHE